MAFQRFGAKYPKVKPVSVKSGVSQPRQPDDISMKPMSKPVSKPMGSESVAEEKSESKKMAKTNMGKSCSKR